MSETDKQTPIAYIDGENFSFRVAETLVNNGRIKEKNALTAIDIRGLLEQTLSCNNLTIRYYGTRVRVVKDTPELKEKPENLSIATESSATPYLNKTYTLLNLANFRFEMETPARSAATKTSI